MAFLLFRRLTPRLSCSRIIQNQYATSTTSTTKATSAKKKPRSSVHQMYRENEMLFGKLLETSKERAKSLKITSQKINNALSEPKTKAPPKPKAKLDIFKYTARGAELVEEIVPTRKPRTIKPKVTEVDSAETESKPEAEERMKVKSKTAKAPVEASTNLAPKPSTKVKKTETKTVDQKKQSVPQLPHVEPEEKPKLELPEFLQLEPCKPIRHAYPYDPHWVRVPSVTKILSATMAPEQKQVLERWEKKKIAELGLAGFHAYKADLFLNGKDLHANIAEVLCGTSEQFIFNREPVKPYWNSVRTVLATLQDVQVVESFVQHAELGYCGVVDCIAKYKDKLVLIDWKTSERSKPVLSMTYDTPLQIAAYIEAINSDPQYNFEVKEGLIVMTYKTGQISDVFHLTQHHIDHYWSQWTRRLEQYKTEAAAEANENKAQVPEKV